MLQLHRRAFVAGAAALSTSFALNRAFAQATPSSGIGPIKPYELPPLPYPAQALEPHIDAKTMEIHHGKHHAAYVNNLNAALKDHEQLAKMPLHELLAKVSEAPESVRTALRNNGGGHANHSMFWQIMGKDGGSPEGDLKAAIDSAFGGLDKLQEQFNAAGGKVFGSGWVFVTVDTDGKLALTSKPNQDTPLMEGGRVLFGNDVWEHAYYLNYQNRRADYLKAWWNVVNWKAFGERYAAAKAGKLQI
jgi:superoxide dismutase, Fe-Mn family